MEKEVWEKKVEKVVAVEEGVEEGVVERGELGERSPGQ